MPRRFRQVAAPFGVDIGGTNPAFWTFSVESEFDSWLSVGTDLSPAGAQAASPGLGLVRPTATLSRLNACCREPSSSHAMVWLLQDAWTNKIKDASKATAEQFGLTMCGLVACHLLNDNHTNPHSEPQRTLT